MFSLCKGHSEKIEAKAPCHLSTFRNCNAYPGSEDEKHRTQLVSTQLFTLQKYKDVYSQIPNPHICSPLLTFQNRATSVLRHRIWSTIWKLRIEQNCASMSWSNGQTGPAQCDKLFFPTSLLDASCLGITRGSQISFIYSKLCSCLLSTLPVQDTKDTVLKEKRIVGETS